MEESKKYADMSYLDFIEEVLEIKNLSNAEKILIKMFEECKVKKIEYTYPIISPYFKDKTQPWGSPIVTLGSGNSTNIKNPYEVTCKNIHQTYDENGLIKEVTEYNKELDNKSKL